MSRFPLQNLLRNARALDKQVGLALSETALGQSQYRLLSAFDQQAQLTVSELSERLSIAKPSVTNLVKQLQGMGLLQQRVDPEDQRSRHLTLTRDGVLRLKIANEYLEDLEKRLARQCSAEQLAALQSLDVIPSVKRKTK